MIKRIFLAINLPNKVKKALIKYKKGISEGFEVDPIKYTKEEKLHIIVHFFGNLNEKEIQSINCNFKSFKLRIIGIDYDPSKKMIWAYLDESKELKELKKQFSDESIVPHITLGKINQMKLKYNEYLPDIYQDLDIEFEVEEIDVMESKGNKYIIRKSI